MFLVIASTRLCTQMSLRLRCLVAVAFISQCPVSHCLRTNVFRIDSQQFPNASHKEVTYIRHGQSVGNAGVWGAITKGSVTAYRDGTLTVEGKKQVADRVDLMDEALVNRILGAEVVMSSPLRRAMGTTILLLAHTKHKKLLSLGAPAGDCEGGVKLPSDYKWPHIEVVTELREKVKTHSESPGEGDDGDPMIWVRRTVKKAGQRLFCDENAMDAVAKDIEESYAKEKVRTTDNGVPWQKHHENIPLPEDGYDFVRMIHAFKRQVLAKRSESRVVLVGHSGWSRFAFAPFMPRKEGQPINETLAHGALKIKPLKNVGTLRLQFETETAEFRFDPTYRPDPEGILPGNKEFPNFDKKYKEVMLSDFSEASAGGALPPDATLDELVLLNKVGDWTGTKRKRIFTLSSSKTLKKAYLSWFDKWGEPKGLAEISGDRTSCKADAEDLRIELKMIDGDGEDKESTIELESTAQFEEFKKKLEKHRNMFAAASACVLNGM